jgi:hypothetical protein
MIVDSKEKKYCSNTLKLFADCNCNQCQESIFKIEDGSLVPSQTKNYLITEEEKEIIIRKL